MPDDDFKVDVVVLRASQLPALKTTGQRDSREFYVTVVDAGVKRIKQKRTKAIRSAGNTVDWDERLDGVAVRPSSQIILSLYAKQRILSDILIGTIKIDPVSTTKSSFTIESDVVPAPIIVLTILVHVSRQSAQLERPAFSRKENDLTPFQKPASTQDLKDQMKGTKKAIGEADDAVKFMNMCGEWKEIVQNVQWVMETMKDVANIHPYAKAAWLVISAVPQAFLAQFERDDNVILLVKTMRETFDLTQAEDFLKAIEPNSNEALILKVMLKHLTICNEVIQRYAKDKEFSKRLFRNITGGVSDEIKSLCDTLAKLRRDLLDNAIINMQIAVHLIQKSMNILSSEMTNLDFDAKIDDLPYRSGWSSTANKNGCLEGTRAEFLEYIHEWIKNPTAVRGLVLFGKAGTGKSSIAFEIASQFCFEARPGSYFSFSRTQKSTQKDHHLFTTIIRDMSDHYPSFKVALGKLITNNTPLRTSDDFNQIFHTLLLGPLETVGASEIPNLIVIDGLDESGDPEKLAEFLSRSLARLPQNIRVFITSRSEGGIELCFANVRGSAYEVHQMHDPKLIAKLENDIRLYFQRQLTRDLFQRHGEELVKKAEGLFQWAAVACGYLNKPPAGYTEKDCLRGLLGQGESDKPYTYELQSTKLYKLYEEVLSGYFTSNVTRPRFRSVIGQLLGTFEPLSIDSLSGLRQFVPGDDGNVESVLAVVKFMGSLLSNVTSDDRSLPVVPLHTSFREFLTDETNRHSFSVDLDAVHCDLTCACLDLMLNDRYGLKFNVCEFDTSHLPNTKVEDLQSRIDKFLSPSLIYACRFWDDHLERVPFDEAIFHKLERFFSTKFLFWLEVLSITKTIPLATQGITATVKWLQSGLLHAKPEMHKVKALIGLVTDARTFLRSFGKIIAMSAPHIYVSALSFAPTSSEVYKTYAPKFPPTLCFKQGQLDHWPALEMFIAAPSAVNCVTFSPNDQWIASACWDGTVYLWNTTTGMLEGTPFTGHTGAISSIAFSSDGQHIISGSYDCTIRLWNVATGTTVGNPWTGHKLSVMSVVFSPNDRHAVSGSNDHTVRIWNVATGSMEGSPLTQHTGMVHSVAFSPDSQRIISGSADHTVRVWDFNVANGMVEVAPLLTLHTPSYVSSVAFSPNGQQIAAGCNDNNVYLWDNSTEPVEGTPLTGHAGAVICVQFSPDGQHIVSGPDDGKLLLWNTLAKRVEGSPLISHPASVCSVAFSSDGQRIVSGTYDGKICVWSAVAAMRVVDHDTGTVLGHSSPVQSVAFSPVGDQRLVASGSDDHTICLWNVETGSIIGSPLRGHTAAINSIAFSPDGRQIVSVSDDRTVYLWDLERGILGGKPFTGHTHFVCAVAFSPDGQRIVSGAYNGEVLLWNTETGVIEGCPLIGCSDSVRSVDFSGDGQQVVCGSSNGEVWLWDVSDEAKKEGCQLTCGDNDVAVILVAFLFNSEKIISCSTDYTVCLWTRNASTGEIDGTSFSLRNSDQDYTPAFSLSPDGSRLAAADYDNHTICVWNLATRTRENLCPLAGHTALVRSLAFSPDGRQLVSSSQDSVIRVWDLSMEDLPADVDVCESAINDEGWICGRQGELLVWIPQVHRPTLQHPNSTIAIIASHQIRLDFSNFVHGKGWHVDYQRK